MFTTRHGAPVDLDDMESVTIRPLTRPAPTADIASADERSQAEQETWDGEVL